MRTGTSHRRWLYSIFAIGLMSGALGTIVSARRILYSEPQAYFHSIIWYDMETMRRLLTIMVCLTMFYQGMAAAYWVGTACSAEMAAHAYSSDVHVSVDPCCDGLNNETDSNIVCGSAAACHVSVMVIPESFTTNLCSSIDAFVTLEKAYGSVEIGDVWRPPMIV